MTARFQPQALIFDFDGVLIESEFEGNRHMAELLTALGHPTTVEQAVREFTGLSGAHFLEKVERWIGGPIPQHFHDLRAAEDARVVAEGVAEVAGAVRFVRSLPPALPRAIASSSSTRWLKAHLAHLELTDAFVPHLYSGKEHVARGKPYPDLYQHAANALAVPIERCAIIEDSVVGATGAGRSGAFVIGLVAASHCGPHQGDELLAAGANVVARDFGEVAALLGL